MKKRLMPEKDPKAQNGNRNFFGSGVLVRPNRQVDICVSGYFFIIFINLYIVFI